MFSTLCSHPWRSHRRFLPGCAKRAAHKLLLITFDGDFAISILLLVHRTLGGQEWVRGLWAPRSFQPELDGACNQD